jgi:hypothetical protein
MMNDLIATYEANGFNLTVDTDRLVARCDRPSKRARLGFVNEFHYRYSSFERMTEALERFIKSHLKAIESRAQRKLDMKAQKEERANAVKVGDLFVDSWGFEQTQVDLYQVVAKPSPKTVVVRPIACETVEGSEGNMSRMVRAVPNAFIGEEIKKRLDNYGGFKTYSFSSARPTTAEAKHYNSWYY